MVLKLNSAIRNIFNLYYFLVNTEDSTITLILYMYIFSVLMSKQNPSMLKVRNFTKEELAKMNPDDRQKPYICESKFLTLE